MKRNKKNLIMTAIILLMIGAIYLTINFGNTNNTIKGGNPPSTSGTPPEKPDGTGTNTGDMFNDNSSSLPDENNNGNPPSMPNGTPPEKTSGDNIGAPPSMIDGNGTSSTNTIVYVLLGIESLVISGIIVYLLMSNFNKKTFIETYED